MLRNSCFAAGLLLASLAHAQAEVPAAPSRPQEIFQQRLPDGTRLLTDRPRPGARTERAWSMPAEDAEDAEAAAARRAAALRESERVSERIGRDLQAEREREALEARLGQERARDAAELEAIRLRNQELEPVYAVPWGPVTLPRRSPDGARPDHPTPPATPPAAAPETRRMLPPRPGATPPPGTPAEGWPR